MSEQINGGFPPIKLENNIIEKKDQKEKKTVERFYASTSLNIVKILNTKKTSSMIQQEDNINAIDSL